MRQALDSEIITKSMEFRQNKKASPYNGNEVKIVPFHQSSEGMLEWADQVICATNARRQALNQQISKMKGLSITDLEIGQKLICNRNYWDVLSEDGAPLVNGTIGYVDAVRVEKRQLPSKLGGNKFEVYVIDFWTENEEMYCDIAVDKKLLLEGTPTFTDERQLAQIHKYYSGELCFEENPLPLTFDLGWAITLWKAQGSEWNKVLLFEEGHPYDKVEHQKYLYTGATRAAERLVIVQK